MRFLILVIFLSIAAPLHAQNRNAIQAIQADPARDGAHPARMEVLHIPSGGKWVNGVAYLASGVGAHPTAVFFHGLPGNEKNQDLAQAVRRAGWNAVMFSYRGSWGSPGKFSFSGNLEDAEAVLAFLEDPASARKYGIDTKHLVVVGHSMGGWVVAQTAVHHPELAGAALISAADMGSIGKMPHAQVVEGLREGMESLAETTPERMADELASGSARWTFDRAAPGLAKMPMLVLTSDDGFAMFGDGLASKLKAEGNSGVTTMHRATDHSWSDSRIALATELLAWLQTLQ
ncbi:alpha/beta hydrolase family protein [Solilutibacter silvestris]|uniref:Alpha/beta hydrolase family n=1 Tax=Solilutibacter silvestris TaxID=1645665 RepID=A0A2K1Q121_9GAMM|nr:alpha/beta fold hydrolase [Lysobacter silvestris]PNS08742.1 Alpha/beta hydrolase family [Lysobacter silvestris]